MKMLIKNFMLSADTARIIAVLLFVFVAVLSNTAAAQDQKAQLSTKNELTPEEFNQWTAFIDSLVAKQQFSGIVLLADNGQVKFQKAYGLARRSPDEPNRLDTQLSIASISKTFVAVSILQLVEKGKLSLDDTVEKVAPGLLRRGVGSKIKIKHLLNHTSGLENLTLISGTLKNDALPVLEAMQMKQEPATEYDYNDWNFFALEAIIERITGEDHFKYVQENILKPLKMNSTGFYRGKLPPRGAFGYYSDEENGKIRFGTRWHRGMMNGGQYSTVNDLNVFLRALVTNRLLSPEMTRLMMTPKPELKNTRYGYGIQYFLDGALVGHSGGSTVYAMDAWALTYPPTGYSLIILSNLRTKLGDDSTGNPIVVKLLDFIEK